MMINKFMFLKLRNYTININDIQYIESIIRDDFALIAIIFKNGENISFDSQKDYGDIVTKQEVLSMLELLNKNINIIK